MRKAFFLVSIVFLYSWVVLSQYSMTHHPLCIIEYYSIDIYFDNRTWPFPVSTMTVIKFMLESNTKIVYTKYPFTSPTCAAIACVCELLPIEMSAAIVLVALHLGYFYMWFNSIRYYIHQVNWTGDFFAMHNNSNISRFVSDTKELLYFRNDAFYKNRNPLLVSL
jgi:hypothetical protein